MEFFRVFAEAYSDDDDHVCDICKVATRSAVAIVHCKHCRFCEPSVDLLLSTGSYCPLCSSLMYQWNFTCFNNYTILRNLALSILHDVVFVSLRILNCLCVIFFIAWLTLSLAPSPSPRERCYLLRSVCLYVCLSARISQKPHVQTSRNLCYLWPWLGPLTTMQYVLYFRLCGWRHVFT